MLHPHRTPSEALLAASLSVLLLSACTNKDTKGLWIANRTTVVEYVPRQLDGPTSSSAPHLVNASDYFGAPQGVSFDAAGNLWVVDPIARMNGSSAPALLEFSADQINALGSHGAPDPVAVITSSAFSFPQQSAFDGQGNQWVTDHDNNEVLVFSAAQLAVTGIHQLTPAVTLTSTAFNGPLGIAFDTTGNLWIANNGGVTDAVGNTGGVGTTVVEFPTGILPAVQGAAYTQDLTPVVILSDDGAGSIQAPWALTFDAKGNLLVSNAASPDTVVEFGAGSLARSGAPTPTLTISSTTIGGNATLDAPNGICLDNAGELAVLSSSGVYGLAFYPTPLPHGAATPLAFIAPGGTGSGTTLDSPAGCVFGPVVQ